MKKTFAVIVSGLVLLAVALSLASGTGASFNDGESTSTNQLSAGAPDCWTQTTAAQFANGVPENVDTSASPVDVLLASDGVSTEYSPSNNTGAWSFPRRAYSSDNSISTYNPTTIKQSGSPSVNTGTAWTNPENAYSDKGGYASITSGAPSGSNVWGTFGFSLDSEPVTRVRVRYDAWTPSSVAGVPNIRIDVSWDGGTTWSSKQSTTMTYTQTTYWYDITAATAWTPAKLSNANLKVRVDASTNDIPAPVYLDWLQVEVTCYLKPLSHSYTGYGITLTSDTITGVEVGIEAYAGSGEKVQLDVTWDGGVTWSSKQTSAALGNSDPNSTTWFSFASATGWTPQKLDDSHFQVRIWYLNTGSSGQVALDYIPVRVTCGSFVPSGTIASTVLSDGNTGSKWNALFWEGNTPSGTGIAFEVRAQDQMFDKNDTGIDWIPLSGGSPQLSSLPSGKYKQWRATLTSAGGGSTPVLSEVRLYYYP